MTDYFAARRSADSLELGLKGEWRALRLQQIGAELAALDLAGVRRLHAGIPKGQVAVMDRYRELLEPRKESLAVVLGRIKRARVKDENVPKRGDRNNERDHHRGNWPGWVCFTDARYAH